MLLAVRYDGQPLPRREDAAYQKELAQRLLRWALQREYGLDLAALKLAKGPHGKPYFPGHAVQFNLSHCPGMVCCALCGSEVGVDVERVRPFDPRLARRICTGEELSFLEVAPDRDAALTSLWTLKESRMKQTGEGFSMGFRNAAFFFEQGMPHSREPGILVRQFRQEDWIVSVCCREKPPESLEFVELEKLS